MNQALIETMNKGFELPFVMPDEAYVGFLKCIKSDDTQLEAFATFVIRNFGKPNV